MSNGITPAPDKLTPGSWGPSAESAPSVLRDDDPGLSRIFGIIGSMLVIFGGSVLLFNRMGRSTAVGPALATLALTLGMAGLLFHAAFDRDIQFRRIYMGFGFAILVLGAFLCVLPYPAAMFDQFGPGYLCLTMALLFLLAFFRNETDPAVRNLAQMVLLGAGALMAIVGLIGGNIRGDFLAPTGLLLALLGLVYLTAYVATRGTDDDRAYNVGLGIGIVGTLVFVIALGRSVYPMIANQLRKGGSLVPDYLVPNGFLLIALGAVYLLICIALVSDNPFVVLVRRELGSFFYSPIAYFVLFAYTLAHGYSYFFYLGQLLTARDPIFEPMVSGFILQWGAVIATMVVVPVLTMRLLSEEKRTGTFEVLLTAPIEETTLVLSKFVSAFVMFMVTWAPFALLLVALRVGGGQPFDYRPLLSFFVGLCLTGAGFVSMGLFCSSLTKSQIASFVLCFVAMLAYTLVFLVKNLVTRLAPDSNWNSVLTHISYIDIWIDTLDGRLVPRLLLFHISAVVLWLFLTIKVLEARRWA